MSELFVGILEDNPRDQETIKSICSQVAGELGVEVEFYFYEYVDAFRDDLENLHLDLLIADLNFGEDRDDRSGWQAVEEVLDRELTPVIVYSAVPLDTPSPELENVLIALVPKGGADRERFVGTLGQFFRGKLGLNQEEERIIAEYRKISLDTVRMVLGDGGLAGMEDPTLAAMAVSRLTSYLINEPSGGDPAIPPESMFLYPPLQLDQYPEALFLGDFLLDTEEGDGALWVVVSPSCDLVFGEGWEPKIEDVLLLRCYRNHTETPFLEGKNRQGRIDYLKSRLNRGTVKVLKCPQNVFETPHLLISFKDYSTRSYLEITAGIEEGSWRKVSTLSTPYAEGLQNFLIRDMSRIGTPHTATLDEERDWIEVFAE